MKFKAASPLALLVLLVGMVVNGQTAALAAKPSQQEPPLRLSEPLEVIVADLESFIPEYMRQEDITRRPVTAETLFEVASNSKVVTGYIALRMVDQGLLSLDEPLNAYLPEPWLPPSEYRDVIALRHVLSHTSGLGHGTLSRENLFAPSRGYSYSAVGFQYLQAVIEQVSGQILEQVAREMAFTPLGMSSSSFVNRADLTSRTANGHVHAILATLLFAVSYVVSLLIAGLMGLVILRLWTGQWRPRRWMVTWPPFSSNYPTRKILVQKRLHKCKCHKSG